MKKLKINGLTVLRLQLEKQIFDFHFSVSHHSCYSNKKIIETSLNNHR